MSRKSKMKCRHDKPLDVCANCTAIEQIGAGRIDPQGIVIHPDGREEPLTNTLCKHNLFPEVCTECMPVETHGRGERDPFDCCPHGIAWTDDCLKCEPDAAETKNNPAEPKPSTWLPPRGGVYTGSWYTPCSHDPSKPVVTINGCGIYACRWSKTEDWKAVPNYNLLMDCRGDGESGRIKLPPQLEHLRKYVKADPWTIGIPWNDRQAPPLEFGFWKALVKSLPKGGVCIVTCVGAHGRTGTAIAAMMIADNPGMSDLEAIAAVRTLHCDEAIESESQEAYLRQMALKLCPKAKRAAIEAAHVKDAADRAARAEARKAVPPKPKASDECFCDVARKYVCSRCEVRDNGGLIVEASQRDAADYAAYKDFDRAGVLITHTVAPCGKGERHYGTCAVIPETLDALTRAGD